MNSFGTLHFLKERSQIVIKYFISTNTINLNERMIKQQNPYFSITNYYLRMCQFHCWIYILLGTHSCNFQVYFDKGHYHIIIDLQNIHQCLEKKWIVPIRLYAKKSVLLRASKLHLQLVLSISIIDCLTLEYNCEKCMF